MRVLLCCARFQCAYQEPPKGRDHSFCMSLPMMVAKVEPGTQEVISEFGLEGSLPVRSIFLLPSSCSFALDFHLKILHIEHEDVFGVLDIWIEYKCKNFL